MPQGTNKWEKSIHLKNIDTSSVSNILAIRHLMNEIIMVSSSMYKRKHTKKFLDIQLQLKKDNDIKEKMRHVKVGLIFLPYCQ